MQQGNNAANSTFLLPEQCCIQQTSPCVVQPGVHRRAWCAVNDHCSDTGPVWQSKHCILMEPVMEVPSRGTNLQEVFCSAAMAPPVSNPSVHVDLKGVDWLHFKGWAAHFATLSSEASVLHASVCTIVHDSSTTAWLGLIITECVHTTRDAHELSHPTHKFALWRVN